MLLILPHWNPYNESFSQIRNFATNSQTNILYTPSLTVYKIIESTISNSVIENADSTEIQEDHI